MTTLVAGLGVLAADAEPLFEDLVAGAGLPALLVSVAAGIATLGLVRSRRFDAVRYSAGVAVAAIIAGWALAQQPTVLPGLTIEAAAAGDATLVATLIGLVVGLAIVLPSLFVQFRLVLRGRFDPAAGDGTHAAPQARAPIRTARGVRGATAACLLAGVALMLFGGTSPAPSALSPCSLSAPFAQWRCCSRPTSPARHLPHDPGTQICSREDERARSRGAGSAHVAPVAAGLAEP